MSDDKQDDLPEPALTIFLPTQLEIHDEPTDEVLMLHLIRRGATGDAPVAGYGASWPLLVNREKAEEWLQRTLELYAKQCQGMLLNTAGTLLRSAAATALMETGLAPFTPRGIMHDFVSEIEKLMREVLGVEQGRPALWTHAELSKAILEAMRELKPEQRNYNKVAERLRTSHPDRAPKNGDSLKKMVKNLKVDWMGIKRSLKK